MRSPKSILSGPAIFWSRAKIWSNPLASFNYRVTAFIRKNISDKYKAIFGIQIFVNKGNNDLIKGLVLLQDSFDIIKETSPALIAILKQEFEIITICNGGARFRYFPMDKSLLIDGSKLPRIARNKLRISWATRIISYARGAALIQGRHGYIGIRYVGILRTRAAIRFARKCIDAENHLYVLSLLNVLNKDIANLRPKRRYYERFLRDDLEKWSFGKNLTVARDGLMVIEREASDQPAKL